MTIRQVSLWVLIIADFTFTIGFVLFMVMGILADQGVELFSTPRLFYPAIQVNSAKIYGGLAALFAVAGAFTTAITFAIYTKRNSTN